MVFPVCVCVLISLYKNTSHIEQEPTHMISFYLNYLSTTNGHLPRALPATQQQQKGICHLPLWRLNPVLLQLLTFNSPP